MMPVFIKGPHTSVVGVYLPVTLLIRGLWMVAFCKRSFLINGSMNIGVTSERLHYDYKGHLMKKALISRGCHIDTVF